MFQSTLPCGERPNVISKVPVICEVSIHAPVRGATKTSIGIFSGRRVSIHAPVRGATLSLNAYIVSLIVSIHAPVRGATLSGVE